MLAAWAVWTRDSRVLTVVRHSPTAPARALGADGDVSPGGGIDDLQNRYYELDLVVLWPNYDCLTLMHRTGSSLDHLGVDQ